jgi:hypothetical protein
VELFVLGFVVVVNLYCKSNNFSRVQYILRDAFTFNLIFFISILLKVLLMFFIIYHRSLENVSIGEKLDYLRIIIEYSPIHDIVGIEGLKMISIVNPLFKGVNIEVGLAKVSGVHSEIEGIEVILNASK